MTALVKPVILVVLLGLASIGATQSSTTASQMGEDGRQNIIRSAMNRLNDAQVLIERGSFAQAEALCRASIEEIDNADGNSYAAHLALSKVYLFWRRYSDAAEEVCYNWRPSARLENDLLAAIITPLAPTIYEHSKGQAETAIIRYFVTHKEVIESRIGPMTYEVRENEDKMIAKAALLYAAEPSRRPQEAMMFLRFCDKGLPKHPAVAYVRGLVQIRLDKKDAARKDLEYAVANGEGSLPAKAKDALAKLLSR